MALVLLPKIATGVAPTAPGALGAYLVVWGLFTAVMFYGTLRLNRALQLVFGTLVILFFVIACAEFTGNAGLAHFGGYEGIVCGLLAMYTGLALVINEVYGSVVLPIGPVAK